MAGESCVRGTCTGSAAVDADGDGFDSFSDCDDADASVHPRAPETCNGVDDNCDGVVDEGCGTLACRADSDCAAGASCVRGTCTGGTAADADGDGFAGSSDCDDTNASVYPGASETCNAIDDNCDGVVDEGCGGAMTRCASDAECAAGQACVRGYCFAP